jgi:hypothetical protein
VQENNYKSHKLSLLLIGLIVEWSVEAEQPASLASECGFGSLFCLGWPAKQKALPKKSTGGCVQESIGSTEPNLFTGFFFLVFITGLLPLENFCTNFQKTVSAGARSQHPLMIE